MENKIKYVSLVVVFLCLFCACTQEINLDELRPEPRLVLNSLAVVGQPVTASVSKTWFFTEKNPNITIKDAVVSLYVNDNFQEKMIWMDADSEFNSKGLFQSVYYPGPGDKIEIRASVENYKNISASVTVPSPCAILDVSTELMENYEYNQFFVKARLKTTFRDDPSKTDFYLFFVEEGTPVFDFESEEYTGEYKWKPAYVEYEEEPLFISHITPLEKVLGYDWLSQGYGRVFTDELINGKEYTLKVAFSATYFPYPPEGMDWSEFIPDDEFPVKYRITLYTLAEPYYRYMKSIISMTDQTLHQQLIKAGLAEPVSIFTNIDNGIGIVGSCNPSFVEITLGDFVP